MVVKPAEPEGPSDRRVLWALAAGAVAAALALAVALGGGDDEPAPAAPAVTTTTIDLATVTNEQLEAVVAEHPEIVGMRLALVERYIADQDWARAQAHAEEAAVRAQTIEERSRALSFLGLTTALLGDGEGGAGILVQSLALDPSNRESLYYLARVRYEVQGRPDLAVGPLEQLLEFDDLSPDQRDLFEGMLAEVQVAAGIGAAATTTVP